MGSMHLDHWKSQWGLGIAMQLNFISCLEVESQQMFAPLQCFTQCPPSPSTVMECWTTTRGGTASLVNYSTIGQTPWRWAFEGKIFRVHVEGYQTKTSMSLTKANSSNFNQAGGPPKRGGMLDSPQGRDMRQKTRTNMSILLINSMGKSSAHRVYHVGHAKTLSSQSSNDTGSMHYKNAILAPRKDTREARAT